MLLLHPIPEVQYACPDCRISLDVTDWYLPGMRNLADLKCSKCGKEFYGDLLSGQALKTPMLLEKETGAVHDKYEAQWFGQLLKDSYLNRINKPVKFTIIQYRKLNKPILLNCLDVLYGHCLLKLLNAQYYIDNCPNFDLIVLVPHFLKWLVPNGVAEVWIVDLPLKSGSEWNELLASEIKSNVENMKECWLSVALPHPHPTDYNIERFSRIPPFPIDEWNFRLMKPTMTFIWRDDRTWHHPLKESLFHRIRKKRPSKECILQEQNKQITFLAEVLRDIYPKLDFAVAGVGNSGGLPEWISDLRTREINDAQEREWCELYARSIVVVGVHGSNMLLPSAHSGSVIELMPVDRWGNILQDILFRSEDCRERMFRNRFIPISTSPQEVAISIVSLLQDHGSMLINLGGQYCRHNGQAFQDYPSIRASLFRKTYIELFKHNEST